MQSLGHFSIDPQSPNALGIDDAVLIAAVHGAFFGSSLPAAQIEGRIAAHIPRRHITDVAAVYSSRWWDYRRLSPGHSFYLFAQSYYRASAIAARKMNAERKRFTGKGGGTGASAAGIYGGSLIEMSVEGIWDREQAHLTGLWKAMLVADALGIPYPEFCRLACRIAFERLWKRLPRPSQLYSDQLGAYVLDEWETLLGERLFLPKHPMYAAENYAGLEVQDAYRDWVIEQIKRQPEPVMGLMDVVFIRKQLPEAEAAKHFSDTLLRRARLLAS